MKTFLTLAWIASIAASHAQGFIRQIQVINNQPLIYDIPVGNDNGTVQSRPLTAESSVFQLYTNVPGPNNTQTLTKLDEKTVGTFLPTAGVQILTEDPYFPPRTRADKPYSVRLSISGLRPGSPDVPEYAKTVHTARSYKVYDSTTFQPTSVGGNYADTFSFRQNGTYVESSILQRLPGDNPGAVTGEETFVVSLHPDAGPYTELAKATVQVWPVAVGAIAGIEEGKRYFAVPTDGRFSVRNIYPKSVTYAQVYKGPHVLGTTGTPLPSTVVSYDTYLPQTAVLTLTDLPSVVDGDGTYTVEVLTITPFNNGAPELLTHVSFVLKRTLKVNSMITTAE